MSLRHKNQDSVFSKNIVAYFKKNIQTDPTPDFELLVKVSDGKCNNSTLMNSTLDDKTKLYYHRGGGQL